MRFARTVLASIMILPAAGFAATLYKSVDPNGIVMFSDMPPPASARILEEREIPAPSGNYGGEPSFANPAPMQIPAEQWLDSDAMLSQANAHVDQAERALAEARRAAGPTLGPLRLNGARLSIDDEERIEREKRNVKLARQRLMELLRDRRLAAR